jgi:hypothetical protein
MRGVLLVTNLLTGLSSGKGSSKLLLLGLLLNFRTLITIKTRRASSEHHVPSTANEDLDAKHRNDRGLTMVKTVLRRCHQNCCGRFVFSTYTYLVIVYCCNTQIKNVHFAATHKPQISAATHCEWNAFV